MSRALTDVRGFLRYVPHFRGKIFVLDVDWALLGETSKAEILMDLKALQSVGVQMVLVLDLKNHEDFLDWAADLELRIAELEPADVNGMKQILDRGQAVLVKRKEGLLSDGLIDSTCSLGASKILVLSDCAATKRRGEVIKFLQVSEVEEVDEYERGEDRILLEKSVKACLRGMNRVHLLDAQVPGILLDEVFSNEGVGTMVYTDNYREIRALREEDISELLGMVGRSVRNTRLVPRRYEEIEDALEDYAVMEVDDHVVGCVALYRYKSIAEIACLYVKQTHGGTGYGADLVRYMERRAREAGFSEVFALTNRAADFFEKRLGYEEMSTEGLPPERLNVLQSSGRDSRAFRKEV